MVDDTIIKEKIEDRIEQIQKEIDNSLLYHREDDFGFKVRDINKQYVPGLKEINTEARGVIIGLKWVLKLLEEL